MKISKIFSLFSIFEIILMFFGFLNHDQSLVTRLDILYVILISFLFLIINSYFFKINAFISFIIFYVYNITYLLPFCFILFFPDQINIIISKYTTSVYNFSFCFLLITIFLIISYYILHNIKLNNKLISNIKKNITNRIVQKLIILLIFNIIFAYFNVLSFFSIFFNPQIYLLILVFVLCIPNNKNINRQYIYFYFLLYIAYTIFFGSRSGIHNLLLYFIISFLFVNGDTTINKKYYILVSIGIVFAIILYPIATVFRIANDEHLNFDINLFVNTDNENAIIYFFAKIIQRLSLLDYTYIIANKLYNQSFFDTYFTIKNLILSSLNITFPLSLNDTLVSNNLLSNVTYDFSYDEIRSNWSSGNAFLMDFNHLYLPGFEFLLSFLVIYLYKLLIKTVSNKNIFFSLLYILLISKTFDLFIFFGYDYFFRNLVHTCVTLFFLYIIIIFYKNKISYEPQS